jgi:hypothetical protein
MAATNRSQKDQSQQQQQTRPMQDELELLVKRKKGRWINDI